MLKYIFNTCLTVAGKEAVVDYKILFKVVVCIPRKRKIFSCLQVYIHDANFNEKALFKISHLNAKLGLNIKIPNLTDETDGCNINRKKKS